MQTSVHTRILVAETAIQGWRAGMIEDSAFLKDMRKLFKHPDKPTKQLNCYEKAALNTLLDLLNKMDIKDYDRDYRTTLLRACRYYLNHYQQ